MPWVGARAVLGRAPPCDGRQPSLGRCVGARAAEPFVGWLRRYGSMARSRQRTMLAHALRPRPWRWSGGLAEGGDRSPASAPEASGSASSLHTRRWARGAHRLVTRVASSIAWALGCVLRAQLSRQS
eukprot:scaffold704_cov347-Prasinococcus_capsulatus_cf.AAC.7